MFIQFDIFFSVYELVAHSGAGQSRPMPIMLLRTWCRFFIVLT